MLNQQLRQLKQASQLTAQEIANKSKIPLPTIHKLLSGETTNPKYKTLKAVVASFDYELSIKPISQDDQFLATKGESDILKNYQQLSDAGKQLLLKHLNNLIDYEKKQGQQMTTDGYRELPLYLLPASAGIGNYLDSDQYEFKSFPAQRIPDQAKYAIRVTGNSMEPTYYQNDIVFVKPVNTLTPGDIGIIVINGEGFIKQYQKNELLSFNPSYAPISPSEYDEIRIVGKVLGHY